MAIGMVGMLTSAHHMHAQLGCAGAIDDVCCNSISQYTEKIEFEAGENDGVTSRRISASLRVS